MYELNPGSKLYKAEKTYSKARVETIYKDLVANYSIEFIEQELINVVNGFRGSSIYGEYYYKPVGIMKFSPVVERYILPPDKRGKNLRYIVKFEKLCWEDRRTVKYYSEKDLFYEMSLALNRINTRGTWDRLCKKFNLTKIDYVPSFGEFVEECIKTHLVDA